MVKRRVRTARPAEDRRTVAPAAKRDWTESVWTNFLLIAFLCVVFVGAVHGYDGRDLDRGYDWTEQFTFYRDFLG